MEFNFPHDRQDIDFSRDWECESRAERSYQDAVYSDQQETGCTPAEIEAPVYKYVAPIQGHLFPEMDERKPMRVELPSVYRDKGVA